MKCEAILDYYIYNGQVCSINNQEVFDTITSPSIYEVIRIIEGVPLFAEEHLERMRKSAELLNFQIEKTDQEIMAEIYKLIDINKCYNLNVKIMCSRLYEKEHIYLTYFIKSYYPEREVYEKGINTILFQSARENPNAKLVNNDLRARIYEEIAKKGAFEALLVNQEGHITEGSRSNIFFVKGDVVYTAPKNNVLLGITRNHIMRICERLGIRVIEKDIHINQLSEFNGAFMTATSVNVLPITTIETIKYDSVNNVIIKNISKEYLKDVDKYVKSKRH